MGEPIKLQAKFRGSMVINKKLAEDTYRIARLNEEGEHQYAITAHIFLLKLFYGTTKSKYSDEGDPQMNLGDQDDPMRNIAATE